MEVQGGGIIQGGWRWHAVSLSFALFDSKCFEDNK
jgi:hypothetical protein